MQLTNAERVKRCRDKWRVLGLCYRCGKPKDLEHSKCAECRAKEKLRNKLYFERTKVKHAEYTLNYTRKHFLTTTINGEKVRLIVLKRDYPLNSCCELCGISKPKKLVYHHWRIENKKAYGLWVCYPQCHILTEALEKQKDLALKYENLKVIVNNSF